MSSAKTPKTPQTRRLSLKEKKIQISEDYNSKIIEGCEISSDKCPEKSI